MISKIWNATKKVSDQYRGAYSCRDVNSQAGYMEGERVDPPTSGHYAVQVLDPDGCVVGILEHWYRSRGKGKLAASSFHPNTRRFHNVSSLSANMIEEALGLAAPETPVCTDPKEPFAEGDLIVGRSYSVDRTSNNRPLMIGTIVEIDKRLGYTLASIRPSRVRCPVPADAETVNDILEWKYDAVSW
jgi:hypothetical protein